MVFHYPISSKKKSVIGRKRKNVSSFQRHKDAIADTEAVDQPPAETNSTETTHPPQKRQAHNQWRVSIGIASRDKMVQQKVFRCYVTYPHFLSPPPPPSPHPAPPSPTPPISTLRHRYPPL